MFEYKVKFRDDTDILFSQTGFLTYEDAEYWAIEAIARACEKCEEWEPDKTYTENDFDFAIEENLSEQEVVDKFNNWKNDTDAQKWLEIMMYDLSEITSVYAEKIGGKGYKSDINVTINVTVKKKSKDTELTSVENIQVKLVSNDVGFNQVEKKKVEGYVENWHIDSEIENLLKLYDGELPPRKGSRDSKRMFVDEFTEAEQAKLKSFLQENMIMIISDVIRGRGRFAAEWTLVINKSDGYKWRLIAVNEAISIYAGDCTVSFTKQGNIHLGNITLQRKGGDNGAESANMLQFKANPMILF